MQHPRGDGSILLSASYAGKSIDGSGVVSPNELPNRLKRLEEYDPLEANLNLNI